MKNYEKKYERALQKVESTVVINSKCRKQKGITSCCGCPIYDTCKSNDYDKLLEASNNLEKHLSIDTKRRIYKQVRGTIY